MCERKDDVYKSLFNMMFNIHKIRKVFVCLFIYYNIYNWVSLINIYSLYKYFFIITLYEKMMIYV